MKNTILVVLSLVTIKAYSQLNTSRTQQLNRFSKNTFNKGFSLEFLMAAEQFRNIVTTELMGTYSKLDISLLHRISQDEELRYYLATKYVDKPIFEDDQQFQLFFTEFMYRKKSILNEREHGVYLEGELKNYAIIDPVIRNRYGYDSAFIPQIIIKKSFSRSAGIKLRLRKHFYNANNNDNYTLNSEDRIYFSAYKMFARKIILGAMLKYQHKIRKGDGKDFRFGSLIEVNFNPITRQMEIDDSNLPDAKVNQEIVTIHVGPSLIINRKAMIEIYAETKISNTYDKRDVERIMREELVLGTALYLTAF